ncbi:MAG: Gx transporter family protein [Oscillospiraceae bacterium]
MAQLLTANKLSPAQKCAFLGMAFALAAALSAAESILLTPLIPLPGVRLGLANCVIILVMLTMGAGAGFSVCVMRSCFAALTRGAVAGIMSACGGILSFAAAVILLSVMKRSYIFSSVICSAVHVFAQVVCSAVLTGSVKTLYYLPVLMPAAVCTGICTGIIIRQLLPVINNLFKGGKYIEKTKRDPSETSEKDRKL